MNAESRALPAPHPLTDDGPGRALPLPSALLSALGGGGPAEREALAAGDALVVVTGQQPVFPLPLGLTLQKVATAVALARALGDELKRRVLPLYWSGADDSDFEEARGQRWGRPGRAPLRVSLPAALERRGTFVGDLQVGAAWREFAALAELESELGPRAAEDLGAQQARLLAELFAPWGLIVLDARSPELRIAGRELFLSYAKEREAFAATLDAEGDRLETVLGHRPLRRNLGARALYFLRGNRRNVPSIDDYGELLRIRIKDRPQDLSANAALRPILQDALLPVAAAVLGPGEWDYHLQLRPCFARLGVKFPPAWPRLRAAWRGDERCGLTDAGRESSPLARPGHPLGDPAGLVRLADAHLQAWRGGELREWLLPATGGERSDR